MGHSLNRQSDRSSLSMFPVGIRLYEGWTSQRLKKRYFQHHPRHRPSLGT
jgi:hypothetical protein